MAGLVPSFPSLAYFRVATYRHSLMPFPSAPSLLPSLCPYLPHSLFGSGYGWQHTGWRRGIHLNAICDSDSADEGQDSVQNAGPRLHYIVLQESKPSVIGCVLVDPVVSTVELQQPKYPSRSHSMF